MCFFFFPVVRVYAREVLPAPLDDVHIAVGGARNFVYLPNLFETLRPGRSCACTGDARCLVRIFVFFSALSHYLERIFLFFSPSHVFDSTPSSKQKNIQVTKRNTSHSRTSGARGRRRSSSAPSRYALTTIVLARLNAYSTRRGGVVWRHTECITPAVTPATSTNSPHFPQ